jgi:hypothetical protein
MAGIGAGAALVYSPFEPAIYSSRTEMEARRTFEAGARSSKQVWFVVAALLAVLVLGVAGAYIAKGLTSVSASPSGHAAVQTFIGTRGAGGSARNRISAPDLLDRNAAQAPSAAADRRYR